MKRTALALLPMLALACAASRPPMSTPRAATSPRPEGPLLVGEARVDITPPPGPSTFGHAPDAHVTNGYWTRLYCRVFVLETSPQDRVALVPCDLPAISALLHQTLLERLAEEPLTKDIPPSHVMLAATHTHAGPGHYFESYAYSGVASTRLPGFDPAMLAFLADRIARGIRDARTSLRPAVARWSHANDVWGITRNRSLAPFEANATHPKFPDPPKGMTFEEQAIDPRLDVLEFDAADAEGNATTPLGRLVFFAMHPTVLPATNRLFGADTHGVASRMLESELRREAADRHTKCAVSKDRLKDGANAGSPKGGKCEVPYGDPLVGIFNTNEGDISPKWFVGDRDEAVRVARSLAERVAALTTSSREKWKRTLTLDAHSIRTHLPSAWLLNRKDQLCDLAELGNATGHGGTDHRASIDSIMPPSSDIDPERSGCQAPKREMFGSLQQWLLGPDRTRYPTDVTFGMVRVDDMWLSFVPAELTVHAGAMVNDRVRKIAGPAAQTRVVGLANGYVQYVTTEVEYGMQRYEGGSTLYGPKSAEYFADQAELLARAVLGQSLYDVDVPLPLSYELAPERARLPLYEDSVAAKAMTTPREGHGLCRIPSDDSSTICFWWTDAAPAVSMASPGRWIELVDDQGAPAKTCKAWPDLVPSRALPCDPSGAIDDGGFDFSTTVRGRDGDGYLWGTLFRPTPVEWDELGERRVHIRARGSHDAHPVESRTFTAREPPPACTAQQMSSCALIE